MKKTINFSAIFLALFFMIAVSYDTGESYCVLFPQNGRDIFGIAQRTIIVFDEEEISLIPQVNFEGDARDFGILVPVPALPELSTVGSNIFVDAAFMTAPIIRQSNQGCGCDNNDTGLFFASDALSSADGAVPVIDQSGVTVISEEIVGTFQAVILQATSAADLTQWLNDNDYRFNPEDSNLLSEYVQQEWFFVAMKLDTAQVPQQIDQWWSATTSPARIKFAAGNDDLVYPLKISSISTRDRTEVLVYTIGPDPMRFPDADLEYANAIDAGEAESIAIQYSTLSDFIPAGVFVNKLRRTFTKAEMQQDIKITATDDRSEFRQIQYVNNGNLGFVGLIVLALTILFNRRNKFGSN